MMSWPHTTDGYHLTKDETGQLLKKKTPNLLLMGLGLSCREWMGSEAFRP